MEPALTKFSEEDDILRFTLHGINVCFANAVRRTILSDIPAVVIQTDTHATNQCNITRNTGRLHNEILKQRLSCIPIHTTLLRDSDTQKALPGNYSLVLDAKNDTDNTMFVTSGEFRLKEKSTNKMLSKEEMDTAFPGLFPMNIKTRSYIDFARLRAKMSDEIPGEELHLTADFSVSTAKTNSMYNVVSKCAYGNTQDVTKAGAAWDTHEVKLRSEGETDADIRFHKENFRILDAQRHFIPNSFDFVIQTLGIYENKDLVRKACAVLQNKLIDIIQSIDSIPIFTSETTVENCFDIRLEEEDYTLGKVIEYIMYTKFYEGDKTLTFCGFKKFHPHNSDSTVRVAFDKKGDISRVRHYLKDVCTDAQQVFKDIYELFK
jgi:DNA-directed RNA polymerase subunit L/DNA-directed RNA polymerase alpha subunit